MSRTVSAIIGPGLHGKTTLARYISRKNFQKFKVPSLCFDPYHDETDWGPQAECFGLEERDEFMKRVKETRNHIVFIDEGFSTIGRDKEMTPLFTEIRHYGHKLVVIGHRSKIMLTPVMRDQISTLYLFRQTDTSVKDWVEDFADPRLKIAVGIPIYTFVEAHKGGIVVKRKLTPEQLTL